MNEPILVFLPGLGADHRLFKNQTEAFPNSYAADWIAPLPQESLEEYAVRFAESIREKLSTRKPASVVVCGLSLGGMIAPYVARRLDAVGCILFCTIRDPGQFPRRYYLDWRLMNFCPPLRIARLIVVRSVLRVLLLFPCLFRPFVDPRVVRAFVESPLSQHLGLSRMMFEWAYRKRLPGESDTKIFDGPTLHLHGTSDPLLPIRLTTPDVCVPGGGHLLVLSHPEEMNAAIEGFVKRCTVEARQRPLPDGRGLE